eukprot:4991496-Amphidinium_carterae.1
MEIAKQQCSSSYVTVHTTVHVQLFTTLTTVSVGNIFARPACFMHTETPSRLQSRTFAGALASTRRHSPHSSELIAGCGRFAPGLI